MMSIQQNMTHSHHGHRVLNLLKNSNQASFVSCKFINDHNSTREAVFVNTVESTRYYLASYAAWRLCPLMLMRHELFRNTFECSLADPWPTYDGDDNYYIIVNHV